MNPHIKRIYEWFVRPLAQQVGIEREEGGEQLNMSVRIGIALGDDFRTVAFVKATEDFRLPPTRWQTDSRPNWLEEASERERQVRKGDALVLRSDVRTPSVCEVEHREIVFVMGSYEFKEIEGKVKVIV